MIAMKSSANHPWPWAEKGDTAEKEFERSYPSLYLHFSNSRAALQKRGNQGRFWWELSGNTSWDAYDRPKILYQEIQFHPCYAFDGSGMLANNKAFFLSTADLYLLGVLNSPLMWWHNWRYLPHMKDEALTPVGVRMEVLPIADASERLRRGIHDSVSEVVEQMKDQLSGITAVLNWLRHEFDVAKPTQRLQNVAALDADAFIAEVKKSRGKGKALTVPGIQRLTEEHARSVVPLQTLAAETQVLERRIADLVNEAYGLTPEEVQLMWDTAPPRMPVGRQ
jgi:hypothetical protein